MKLSFGQEDTHFYHLISLLPVSTDTCKLKKKKDYIVILLCNGSIRLRGKHLDFNSASPLTHEVVFSKLCNLKDGRLYGPSLKWDNSQLTLTLQNFDTLVNKYLKL